MTAQQIDWFFGEVLTGIGAPVNMENLSIMSMWSRYEIGNAPLEGRWNPLNTTTFMPGCTNYNSVGVKNFATASDGIIATIRTLFNGYYPYIVVALRACLPADQWGTDLVIISEIRTWGTAGFADWLVKVAQSPSRPQQEADMDLTLCTRNDGSPDPHGAGAIYLCLVARRNGNPIPWIKRHIVAPVDEKQYLADGLAVEGVQGYLLDRAEDGPAVQSGSYPVEQGVQM